MPFVTGKRLPIGIWACPTNAGKYSKAEAHAARARLNAIASSVVTTMEPDHVYTVHEICNMVSPPLRRMHVVGNVIPALRGMGHVIECLTGKGYVLRKAA